MEFDLPYFAILFDSIVGSAGILTSEMRTSEIKDLRNDYLRNTGKRISHYTNESYFDR